MPHSPKVKICGITNLDDALAAVDAGADALGFVFYRESPRHVTADVVGQIVSRLPPLILAVGVFVDDDAKVVRDVFDQCGLGLAQLHGHETPAYCESLGRPILKGIRLRDRTVLATLASFWSLTHVRGLVVDAYSDTAFGGTGLVTDWTLAAEAARRGPILLAGGLTSDNVQEAVRMVQPYGVDISSGVEASPGKKDHMKIRSFVRAAKLASI